MHTAKNWACCLKMDLLLYGPVASDIVGVATYALMNFYLQFFISNYEFLIAEICACDKCVEVNCGFYATSTILLKSWKLMTSVIFMKC